MSREQLSHLLSDMADEAKPASVHQQAVAQSRRVITARTTVTAFVALSLLGSGVAGAAALYPTGSAETPAASGSVELDGTFLNGTDANGQGEGVERWMVGDDEGTPLAMPEDGLYHHSGSMSPDGERIVYYTAESQIKVADLDGGNVTTLLEVPAEETCTAPIWTSDGERVFLDRGEKFGDDRFGFVDPRTSEFTRSEGQPPGCGVQISNDNGEDVFYSIVNEEDDPSVFRTTGDGSENEEMNLEDALDGSYVREITAVSPDNQFACLSTNTEVDQPAAPLERWGDCDVIVDLRTNEPIELDFDAGEDDFWSGGPAMMSISDHFLVQSHIGDELLWQLYDANGDLVNEVPAGEKDGDSIPLAYIPND